MPDSRLSALPSGVAITDADLWYSDQAATSVKQPSTALATYLQSKGFVVGTTSIIGGTNNYILYDNNGIIGERKDLTLLLANTTYFVRTDGANVSGNGKTDAAGAAYQTFQFAYNDITSLYNFGGQAVTIKAGSEVGSKTFAGIFFSQPWVGGGSLTIDGNGANTILNASSDPTASAIAVTCTLPGILTINGVTLTSVSADCIAHSGTGVVKLGPNLIFSTAMNHHALMQGAGATLDTGSNYTISGGAAFHFGVASGGVVLDTLSTVGPFTVTLTGTPAFGTTFIRSGAGRVELTATTYSGAATGQRFQVLGGGGIITPGGASLTNFPGNSAGVVYDGYYGNQSAATAYSGIGSSGGGGSVTAMLSWGVNTNFDVISWQGAGIGWAGGSINSLGSTPFETGWYRAASSIIEQRNGFTGHNTYRVYNTFTDASNYERLTFDWNLSSNVATIGTENAGTGSVRNLRFIVGGVNQLDFGITNSGIWSFNNTISVSGSVITLGDVRAGSANLVYWQSRSLLSSPADGNILLQNDAATTFGLLQLGGTTNAFPALKRSAATLQFRLADDSTFAFYAWAGELRVSSQFDKTGDTALATVSGLSVSLTAGRTYAFRAYLDVSPDAVGGHKYAIGTPDTLTASNIIYQVNSVNNTTNANIINSRQTALGGSVGVASGTSDYTEIVGTITVGVAGTLAVQFAQNVANGTSSVLVGSFMIVQDMP